MQNTTKGEDLIYEMKQFILDNKFRIISQTGISELDKVIDGFETGKIYTVIAPSGVGKTMFGVQIFHECIKYGGKCLYISTEMANQSITARLLTRVTGIDEKLILKNEIPDNKIQKFDEALEQVQNILVKSKPLIASGITKIDEVIQLIQRVAENKEADLIILDHFHNLRTGDDFYKATVNAAHDIQEAVIKYNIAMVVLAQMSKADVKEHDNEVRMARGASDLLDISDVFIVLERPKIQTQKKDVANMDITVSKNRWGQTKNVKCYVKFPEKVIYPEEFKNFIYDKQI